MSTDTRSRPPRPDSAPRPLKPDSRSRPLKPGRLMRSSARRHWRTVVAALGATVVVVAAELRPALPSEARRRPPARPRRADFTVERADWSLLAAVAVLAIGIALLDGLASSYTADRLRRTGDLVVRDLRAAIYSHLQRLTLAFRGDARRPTWPHASRVTSTPSATRSERRSARSPPRCSSWPACSSSASGSTRSWGSSCSPSLPSSRG